MCATLLYMKVIIKSYEKIMKILESYILLQSKWQLNNNLLKFSKQT